MQISSLMMPERAIYSPLLWQANEGSRLHSSIGRGTDSPKHMFPQGQIRVTCMSAREAGQLNCVDMLHPKNGLTQALQRMFSNTWGMLWQIPCSGPHFGPLLICSASSDTPLSNQTKGASLSSKFEAFQTCLKDSTRPNEVHSTEQCLCF